jgi:hypothetical protein
MFEPRIKVPRRLYENLAKLAKAQGYSSTEECAIHILEGAVEKSSTEETETAIRERLKGLGYLE